MGSVAPPEIVIAAHSDLEKVKKLLREDPGLLNVMYEPWAETPLGAASHVGHRPIAEYLLAQGAPMTITTAAMLGDQAAVSRFLAEDRAFANAVGAHGISLLFHAALSGDVPLAQGIVEAGGSTISADHALHGAVMKGRKDMVIWLLSLGADPNAQDYQNNTTFSVAREMGFLEIAEVLSQAGGIE